MEASPSPIAVAKPVTIPSEANNAVAREKIITQLMKFGRVVKVCVNFLIGPFLSSLSRIAINIGNGVKQILMIAKMNVFFNDLNILSSLKISLK